MKGQKKRILEHLQQHGTITSMEAFEKYGVTRLAAVVFDLKKLGYDIITMNVEAYNRYGEPTHFARYYMAKGDNH